MSNNTNTDMAVCAIRETEHPADEMTAVHDGRLICREERDDNWFLCDDTDEWYPNSQMSSVGRHGRERMVCEAVATADYRECNHYGCLMPRRGGRHVSHVGWVSEDAIDNSGDYFCCQCCGDWFHTDQYAEDGNCTDCHGGEDSGPIRDYGDRNYPSPIGGGPLWYGVELEVECTSDRGVRAQATLDRLGKTFVILKNDGSLASGFEIVTAPCTLEKHRDHWAPFFNAKPAGLKSWDTNTCGMHVHISRDALSALQIGKMLVFLNRSDNASFVKLVAGRDSSYAKKSAKKVSDAVKPSGDRYTALNTTGAHTVEVRIFKGTLNRARFFSNLEFCDALVHFTAPAERSIDESTSVPAFLEYVRQKRKRWPDLFGFLVNKGKLPAPKAKPAAQPTTNPIDPTADRSNTQQQ